MKPGLYKRDSTRHLPPIFFMLSSTAIYGWTRTSFSPPYIVLGDFSFYNAYLGTPASNNTICFSYAYFCRLILRNDCVTLSRAFHSLPYRISIVILSFANIVRGSFVTCMMENPPFCLHRTELVCLLHHAEDTLPSKRSGPHIFYRHYYSSNRENSTALHFNACLMDTAELSSHSLIIASIKKAYTMLPTCSPLHNLVGASFTATQSLSPVNVTHSVFLGTARASLMAAESNLFPEIICPMSNADTSLLGVIRATLVTTNSSRRLPSVSPAQAPHLRSIGTSFSFAIIYLRSVLNAYSMILSFVRASFPTATIHPRTVSDANSSVDRYVEASILTTSLFVSVRVTKTLISSDGGASFVSAGSDLCSVFDADTSIYDRTSTSFLATGRFVSLFQRGFVFVYNRNCMLF
mmetsp:Transcript_10154/g.18228  ORF Transcript_10154/g.18228 Transcript_10154/m.18228 type:complete len:407 (-) Transcript_10154:127-1347(-)